jgi:hypothetical protein
LYKLCLTQLSIAATRKLYKLCLTQLSIAIRAQCLELDGAA